MLAVVDKFIPKQIFYYVLLVSLPSLSLHAWKPEFVRILLSEYAEKKWLNSSAMSTSYIKSLSSSILRGPILVLLFVLSI
jgi:hypothetical protein